MKLLDNSTIVTGILYQHKDSSDTQLLGGLTIDIKLFDNIPITGLIYRQERAAEDKILSGVKVTGVVFRHADDLDDVILRSSRIRGVIFQSRSEDVSEAAGGSDHVDASSRVRGSLERGLPEGSQIVGLICHRMDTGEDQVITGPRVNLKILNSYSVVGIMYEGPDEESIKRLTGANITGLLFQQQKADNETIIGDMALVGIIYQDKGVISERLSSSRHVLSIAASVVLYILLISGILGLALLILPGFSPFGFLALPSATTALLLLLMVIVPAIVLVYQRYRSRKKPAP